MPIAILSKKSTRIAKLLQSSFSTFDTSCYESKYKFNRCMLKKILLERNHLPIYISKLWFSKSSYSHLVLPSYKEILRKKGQDHFQTLSVREKQVEKKMSCLKAKLGHCRAHHKVCTQISFSPIFVLTLFITVVHDFAKRTFF